MNKINSLGLAMLALMVINQAISKGQSITIKDAGKISYVGEVVASPCSVSIDSINQQIHIEPVRTNQFKSIGSWVDTNPFTIHLQDCDDNVANEVGVYFEGTTDERDPQVIKTYSDNNGNDTGVGLGIFDMNGNLIVPNTEPQSFQAITNGNNDLVFKTKYRKTRQNLNTGELNATVNFSMYYQ